MPSFNTKPNGVNAGGSWAFSSVSLVADVTDGNDSTYDVDAVTADDLFFDYEDISTIASVATINSLIVSSRLWNPSGGADGTLAVRGIFSGVGALTSTNQTPAAGYTNFDWDISANVRGQTVSNYNSSVFGAREISYTTNPVRLVEQSATIVAVVPAGGFIFLMLSLCPLIGMGLHHMPQLARAIQERTGALILPGEYAQAWRELREHRYPRHFLMRAA